MDVFGIVIKGPIPFDGERVDALIYFDYVGGEAYIDKVMYEGSDIKSILDPGIEDQLSILLVRLCKKRGY